MFTFKGEDIESIMKGKPVLIYKNGKFLKDRMREANITTGEIFEDLRVEQQTDSLKDISEIFVEKTGEISFIKKQQK